MTSSPNRRQFLSTLALGSLAARGQEALKFPPTRVITKGPGFHWFAYYDKLQFSPDNRFVLSNKVSFEHRSPTADDEIEVGMVDLQEKDKWIPLGKSRAWCWQQGCMLQWIPGTESKVIWNDREKDRFVSHILDVKTGEKNTIPSPVYALAPTGKEAVSCDFARVADCRPGYGYAGIKDRFFNDMAPAGSGVTHVISKPVRKSSSSRTSCSPRPEWSWTIILTPSITLTTFSSAPMANASSCCIAGRSRKVDI